jgi:hypothetical protein
MRDVTHALFNLKTIKKMCSGIAITSAQRKAASEWLELLESGRLEKEKQNYFKFALIILKDLLGYPVKEEMGYEEGNVEFTFTNKEGRKVVCFEAKGTDTKDLFAPQYRDKKEHSTPVKQTWDYMGSLNLDYGITTNYNDFVLIDKSKGTSKYHFFDFTEIKNNDDKLREFIAIFSRESIIEKRFVENLYNASVIEEREFTKEFYKLFHETRLMLIKEFETNGVSRPEAIHYAQLFLNRLIFIFFAEDTDKLNRRLFADRMLKVLEAMPVTEHSKYASETIIGLFESLDKGAEIPTHIFGFNGGLFHDKIPSTVYFKDLRDHNFFKEVYQYSELKKEVKLDEFSEKVVNAYRGKLNPIISNLLAMDSFNFVTELNVNILGHIFEQSLTDLEELKGEEVSKRKREGIFYTPEFVTDYICRNTIIPYLSKNGSTTVIELIKEYSEHIEELEKKFREIKILDPACGSGAFLLKAVDILLEIHKEIQAYKEAGGKYTFFKKSKKSGLAEQFTLAKWHEENEARKIIEDNIFGVDINEESVEITKLSLFLKIATRDRKLIDLSQNIKVGNSIVSDKNVDSKAFDWKAEFKDIFDKGGFDIVIGNPPYVRQERLTEFKPYFEKNYRSYAGTADLYVYFLEKGLSNLKDDGIFGVIVSNKWSKATYGESLRRFLVKFKILRFIDFGDLPVFSDATTYPCILLIKKLQPMNNNIFVTKIDSLEFTNFEKKVDESRFELNQTYLTDGSWNFDDPIVNKIYTKIKAAGISLEEYCEEKINRGLLTGLDKVFVIDEKKKDELEKLSSTSKELIKPYLIGKQIKRYSYDWENKYILLVKKGTDIEKYPAVFNYLKQYKKELTERWDKGDWFSLRECSFYDDFLKPKIIYAHFAKRPQFTFDTNNFHLNAKSYILPTTDKYLLGILNSSVIALYSQSICPYVRGEFYEYNKQYVNQFPIPEASKSIKEKITESVDVLLNLHSQFLEKKKMVLSRIRNEFKIVSISMRLSKFYTLNSSEFLSEIKKLSKSDIPLSKLDEWEQYFNKYKNEIASIVSNIENKDKEIDEIVYTLFGINDKERKIIESTLHDDNIISDD